MAELGTHRRVTSWARLAGIAALAIPAVMWIEFVRLGTARPGYNLLTRAASELGARGTPNSLQFTVGFFFLLGALIVLVGISLQTVVARSRAWRIGAGLVTLSGVLLFLSGVFPMDGHSAQATSLHQFVSQSCFALAAVAPVLILAGAPRIHLPSWLPRFWLVTGILGVVVEISAVILEHTTTLPQGIFQRSFMLVLTAWFAATGFWLIRHRAHPLPATVLN